MIEEVYEGGSEDNVMMVVVKGNGNNVLHKVSKVKVGKKKLTII